jgi:hypothetical protein
MSEIAAWLLFGMGWFLPQSCGGTVVIITPTRVSNMLSLQQGDLAFTLTSGDTFSDVSGREYELAALSNMLRGFRQPDGKAIRIHLFVDQDRRSLAEIMKAINVLQSDWGSKPPAAIVFRLEHRIS